MNIFLLDLDLCKNAQYMVDKHIVKMPLESAQLLCSVYYRQDKTLITKYQPPYKCTHYNHPCSKWCRYDLNNWMYLKNIALEICKEYTYRYGKIHKCQNIIEELPIPTFLPNKKMTIIPSCMDNEFKICKEPKLINETVLNYRNYYIYGKSHLHNWKYREKPQWIG